MSADVIELQIARDYTPTHVREGQDWAARIRSSWQKSVEGILETGRILIEAKAALPHGGFEQMVKDRLPFKARTAQTLMQIARNPVLCNPQYIAQLPPAWGTLAQLARMDNAELEEAIGRKYLSSDTGQKDIPELVKRVRKAMGKRVVERASKSTPEHRVVWIELRRHLPKEAGEWFAGLEHRKQDDLMERLVRVILEEMADG